MKRVLIILSATVFVVNLNAQKNPCDRAGVPYSSLPGDTTITLPSGTQITFNRCEYFDLRECLEILEINDTAGLREAGLSMTDENGIPLLTCGMLSIKLNECGKTCFEVPIKIKVRIKFEDCNGIANSVPNLFVANGSVWSQQPEDKIKRVTENNIKYLEIYSTCSVIINCDVKKPGRKVKFIAPKGDKIERLRIGRNCPLFYSDSKFSKPKRKQKAKIYCGDPDKTNVQAVLIDKQNEKVSTDQKKMSEMISGKAKIKCKDSKKSFFHRLFDWQNKPKSSTHKKYFISK
jgi:hypothetical protein